MNNVLAGRIKEYKLKYLLRYFKKKYYNNVLDWLVRDHGSLDLEWLRDLPSEKAKYDTSNFLFYKTWTVSFI